MTDQRDQSIEILLRQRQPGADPQSTDRCVDAESLAAWMDDALAADARAAVEQHAAGCARCQGLLTAMVRSAPEVDARPWWRTLTVKWLVPIAAVATAILTWIYVGRGPLPSTSPQPPSIEASRRTNLPEAAASAPVAPQLGHIPGPVENRSAQPADARMRRGLADSDGRKRDGLAAANEPGQHAAAPPVAGGVAGGIVGAVRPPAQTAADFPAASPAPAPPPPAAEFRTAPPATPPVMPPVANMTSAEPKLTSGKGLAETVGVPRDALAKGSVGALDIQSPDPNYRWRIVSPVGIQRSTDGGMTWAVVDPFPATTRLGAAVALTAGFSPSRDTCWIVGRLGLVLLSTDGATWQRRAFPEQVDLTAVRASDARRATVTTADGRQLVTANGGVTWILVK